MKLVQLNTVTTVMPDQISSLMIRSDGMGLNVRLKDGSVVWVDNDYRKSAYQTKDALEAKINEALQ